MSQNTIDPILQSRLSKYLTSDILDKLPESGALMQASQRLSSLRKTLASFLPMYVASDEEHLTVDYGRLTPGTFLFADVSGFTALSEKLMQRVGAVGTEYLTQVINDYFSTMLEIIAKSNGQLLKFAGDALLIFFPSKPDYDEVPMAINAGLRMQRAMRSRFQPIQNDDIQKSFGKHDMELTMSIGISHGKLYESLVGNINKRDHVIMGRLPGEADEAEGAGIRDDVIITGYLQARYKDEFETKEIAPGFYQVVDNFGDDLGDYEFTLPPRRRAKSSFLFGFDENDQLEHLERELERVEVISRFVSQEIVNKLVVRGDHIESENRLATVIFVHYTGFAELLEAWGEDRVEVVTVMLSRYYAMMLRIVEVHGGVLTRCDPYKMGSRFLITFGAPVAHPDDAERAVHMALEMNRQLVIFNERVHHELQAAEDAPPFVIKQRMGITQGEVFAGEVGWRQRREYTVMGDDVNLSARLTARAEYGQIILSEAVYEKVEPYFDVTPLEPFKAKGKEKLIQAYDVQRIKRSSTHSTRLSDTPFVGRDVIMMSLNMVVKQAQRAPKSLKAVGIYGDMGVGKTRIARQLFSGVQNTGFKCAWATCHAQNTRKTTWSTLVAQLLDIDPNGDVAQEKQQLQARLGELRLSDIEDVLEDLLFGSGDHSPAKPARPQRNRSQAREDIFDRLAGENTMKMRKDELASFRAEMKRALRTQSSGTVPSWDELLLKTSLTDALMKLLMTYAEHQPILLVIDDLHKENQRALNVLKRIVNEVSHARLMIVATYEPVVDLDVALDKVAVADLPEEQTYLMASAILDNCELGERLSRFLWDSTSGRALYIESLIRTLMESNALTITEGVVELSADANTEDIPDNVRGLVISRIDRLDSNPRELLRIASVLGDTFTRSSLAAISEMPPAEIEVHFGYLAQLQLLEAINEEMIRFRHGVTQQAIYEELSRLQRQRLHLKIAEHMQQLDDHEETVLTTVYHLSKAGAPSRAVAVLTSSAQKSESSGDKAKALELYRKALEIFPDDDNLQEQIARLQQGQAE